MSDFPEGFFPFPDDKGYLFLVPPRSVWRKFCEEMDFEGKYIPEPDDFIVIFRRRGDE